MQNDTFIKILSHPNWMRTTLMHFKRKRKSGARKKELKAIILKMRAAATIDELAKIKRNADYLVKTAEFQQIGKKKCLIF